MLARKAAVVAAAKQAPVATVTPPTIHTEPKSWVAPLIGAGGTGLYVGLAAWSYTAATVDDMIGAGVLLVSAFVVAMGAFMFSERYPGFANRRRLVLNLSFAGFVAVVSGSLFWWEYTHRPLASPTADDVAKKVVEKLPPAPRLDQLPMFRPAPTFRPPLASRPPAEQSPQQRLTGAVVVQGGSGGKISGNHIWNIPSGNGIVRLNSDNIDIENNEIDLTGSMPAKKQ